MPFHLPKLPYTYDALEPSCVKEGRNNPAILISGHDLKHLEELLIKMKASGVNVYTHGEMLPAHYYPTFKKYETLSATTDVVA